MTGPSPPPPAAAGLIALSGVAPLLILAVWTPFAAETTRVTMIAAALGYSAVLAGFSAGVRWGAELVREPARPSLGRLITAGLATVPAWAALALLSQPAWAFGVLGALGLGQLAWDLGAARSGLMPAWTFRLRIGLTVIGLLCLALIVFYRQPV